MVSALRRHSLVTQTGSTPPSFQVIAKATVTRMRENWPVSIPTMHLACFSPIILSAMPSTDNGTGCFAMSHLTTGKSRFYVLNAGLSSNKY